MGADRSNRFDLLRAAVMFTWGGLTACSALPEDPASVYALPISRITDAVTAGADRPITAESKPSADQGELRFVVVPRRQAVGGMVDGHQITSRTATTSDRAVHPKKQKADAQKISAPVTTVEGASALLQPVD
jgi:hypothetical protein